MDLLEGLPGRRCLKRGEREPLFTPVEAGHSVSPVDPRQELVCSKDSDASIIRREMVMTAAYLMEA